MESVASVSNEQKSNNITNVKICFPFFTVQCIYVYGLLPVINTYPNKKTRSKRVADYEFIFQKVIEDHD